MKSVMKWNIFCLLLLILTVANVSIAFSADQGYVFSYDGQYVLLDTKTYQVLQKGSLWEKIAESEGERQRYDSIRFLGIFQVFPDYKEKRLFILLGRGQSARLNGFLVLNSDNFKYIDFIEREMSLAPTYLAIDPEEDNVFLTYLGLENPKEKAMPLITEVLSATDFRVKHKVTNSLLRIQPCSCFLKGEKKLYTNHRVFNSATYKLVKQDELLGKPLVSNDCQKGLLLFHSKGDDQLTVLSIYDIKSDRLLMEKNTKLRFRASVKEWRLSKDARFIIRDEEKIVPFYESHMMVKTGTLSLYDSKTGASIGRIKIPSASSQSSNILGFTFSDQKLLYQSSNELFVIDLNKQKILKRIELPFRPVGFFWP